MKQLTWNASFSVNNPVLDAQHKKWIDIYNRLDHTLLHGSQEELLTAAASAVKAMLDITELHFHQEEQYMKEIRFPDLAAHKKLHGDFINLLCQYRQMINRNELVLNTEVLSILKNWLTDHILREDQRYAAFLP